MVDLDILRLRLPVVSYPAHGFVFRLEDLGHSLTWLDQLVRRVHMLGHLSVLDGGALIASRALLIVRSRHPLPVHHHAGLLTTWQLMLHHGVILMAVGAICARAYVIGGTYGAYGRAGRFSVPHVLPVELLIVSHELPDVLIWVLAIDEVANEGCVL